MSRLFLVFFVEGHETEEFGVEIEFDFSDAAVTVFLDEEFGDMSFLVAFFVLVVVVGAVEHHDEVGVLLDGAGFTEVREDWAGVVAAGDGTRELSEGDDRNFKFAREGFQTAGDFGYFLDAVASVAFGTLEELEVVDNNETDVFFIGGATGAISELQNRH